MGGSGSLPVLVKLGNRYRPDAAVVDRQAGRAPSLLRSACCAVELLRGLGARSTSPPHGFRSLLARVGCTRRNGVKDKMAQGVAA